MKKRDLEKIGVPRGEIMDVALDAVIAASRAGREKKEIIAALEAVVADPARCVDDVLFGRTARLLKKALERPAGRSRASAAPFRIWGENIDKEAINQIEAACSLPVALRGALMPDAHVGYGLPIGGVLAVRNAVIPYAVGVDIACRMRMTVFDLPPALLADEPDRFREAINRSALFGVGAEYRRPRQHAVMDMDWTVSPVTDTNRDLAWKQLGTSGSGNHFVEFGVLTVERGDFPLAPGTYCALVSHSGSRGTGSKVASHYSAIAQRRRRSLPGAQRHLAWLDLDTQEGAEYWNAMQLMGQYAAANHELIHGQAAALLGGRVLWALENHHNFAWKESFGGEEVIVHRKGATPASAGTMAIVPGSMGTPGFVVRGKGCPESLNSAAHGAGRLVSRSEARRRFSWDEARSLLDAAGVSLVSAGLDEVPMAYKNIHDVMAAQADLVEILARFDPKIVKMAEGRERAED